MWRELAADLTLLTPEYPGFGSAARHDDVTIAGFAEEVATLIRAEGSGPAVVVGLSLGGYVALALAADHPDTVAALVLANTRADADDADARRAREQAIDTIRIDGLDTYLAGFVPRALSPTAEAETWERVFAIAETQDPGAVCATLEALRDRPDRTAQLGDIDVRTVVIGGADDLITPRSALDVLVESIPGATLHVIPAAGHLTAIERPAEFAAILAQVLPT